jgi:predicted nucleic acid-binding protein
MIKALSVSGWKQKPSCIVQDQIKSGALSLGWSYILDYENAANPCEERRAEIQRWEKLAACHAVETHEIIALMKKFVQTGLKPLDALHVACAVTLDCEVFLTVDRGILRKGLMLEGIRVMSPIDFLMEREV